MAILHNSHNGGYLPATPPACGIVMLWRKKGSSPALAPFLTCPTQGSDSKRHPSGAHTDIYLLIVYDRRFGVNVRSCIQDGNILFCRCLGGALFIKCRLTLSTPQPLNPDRKWKKALSLLWSCELADKQIVPKVIMRQDSAYHWVLEGHRTAAPQEFPLLFYGAPF